MKAKRLEEEDIRQQEEKRQRALETALEAEKERRKSDYRYKIDKLHKEYETYVEEQSRIWGKQRDRSSEIEMEKQLNAWVEELQRLSTDKPLEDIDPRASKAD